MVSQVKPDETSPDEKIKKQLTEMIARVTGKPAEELTIAAIMDLFRARVGLRPDGSLTPSSSVALIFYHDLAQYDSEPLGPWMCGETYAVRGLLQSMQDRMKPNPLAGLFGG